MEKKENKIGKKVGIILLIFFIVFLILFFTKILIMYGLESRVNHFAESSNYHIKTVAYSGDSITIAETYKKGEESLSLMRQIAEDDIRKITTYSNGNSANIYFDTNEDKVAILNTTEIPMISRIQNYLHTENLGQFLLSVLRNSIRIEECNGKECYKIEGYFDNLVISGDNAKTTIYLEKSTGLPVRVLTGTEKTEEGEVSTFTDYWYEFDQVTASDLKEPDIYLYRVEE